MATVLRNWFVFLVHSSFCFSHLLLPKILVAHQGNDESLIPTLDPDGTIDTSPQHKTTKRETLLASRARIYWDCDMDQEEKLMKVLMGVEIATRKALDSLEGRSSTPYETTKYAYHFGSPDDTRDLVITRYLGILQAVTLPERVSVRCINPPGGRCHEDGRILLAYASNELPIIWLCDRFWAVPYFTLSYREDQVSTILHQLTHLRTVMAPVAIDTSVPVEGDDPWQDVSDRSILVHNAYSYAWFAKDVIMVRHLRNIALSSVPMTRGS